MPIPWWVGSAVHAALEAAYQAKGLHPDRPLIVALPEALVALRHAWDTLNLPHDDGRYRRRLRADADDDASRCPPTGTRDIGDATPQRARRAQPISGQTLMGWRSQAWLDGCHQAARSREVRRHSSIRSSTSGGRWVRVAARSLQRIAVRCLPPDRSTEGSCCVGSACQGAARRRVQRPDLEAHQAWRLPRRAGWRCALQTPGRHRP